MANDVFELASDIEVSLYAYPSNLMIWDVSRWDEDNWAIGSETESWQVITGTVSRITIQNGVQVNQGFTRSSAPTCSITFQSDDYDPFTNATVRSGAPVRVRVRPNPTTAPSTWVTLFEGKIDSTTGSYNNQWVNIVTLYCVADLRDILNYSSDIGMTTGATCYAWNFIDEINALGGYKEIAYDVTIDGYLLTGINTSDAVPFGGVVNNILDANAGALVYRPIGAPNPATVPYYYYTSTELEVGTQTSDVDFEAATSANAKRADFSDIVLGINTDEVVNRVTWQTSNAPDAPVTISNAPSRTLLGDIGVDVTTIHDTIELDWARSLANVAVERRVLEISAPVITRAGQLNENLLRDPMDVASVSVSNAKITIDETYLISNVTHEIGVHSWDVTFELWKGR